jgi:hypothetical protein
MNTSEMKITLNLNLDQVNVCLAALSKMPYESVVDLIGLIRNQTIEQVKQLEEDDRRKQLENENKIAE